METSTFTVESCVRGHHVYKEIWTPLTGEFLLCKREFGNIMDAYAVAIITGEEVTVGHVPRTISTMCHLFLRRGGHIVCQVTGNRRHSSDLPQGGLEVPCSLTFVGGGKEVQKIKRLHDSAAALAETKSSTVSENPSKKIKLINSKPSDVSTCDVTDPILDDFWIKFCGHLLSLKDKHDLIKNEKLNDRHINMAQKLLSVQFSSTGIEGFGYSLLQSKQPITPILNGLQIVFDRGNHWVVASSIGRDNHIVTVYDSLYSTVSEAAKAVICNLFDKSKTEIKQVQIQQQIGGQDCGLFAIAIATELLYGGDVKAVRFHQSEMRQHLHACFTSKFMSQFPSK